MPHSTGSAQCALSAPLGIPRSRSRTRVEALVGSRHVISSREASSALAGGLPSRPDSDRPHVALTRRAAGGDGSRQSRIGRPRGRWIRSRLPSSSRLGSRGNGEVSGGSSGPFASGGVARRPGASASSTPSTTPLSPLSPTPGSSALLATGQVT